jgi:hypothetical protein
VRRTGFPDVPSIPSTLFVLTIALAGLALALWRQPAPDLPPTPEMCVPADATSEWETLDLRVVLVGEDLHVRHRDPGGNLLDGDCLVECTGTPFSLQTHCHLICANGDDECAPTREM